MYRVLALLDNPSPRSFAMVAFLTEPTSSRRAVVYGLSGGPRPLTLPGAMSFENFMTGHCRDVRSAAFFLPDDPATLAAGWIGTKFVSGCERAGVVMPQIPPEARAVASSRDPCVTDGLMWLGDVGAVYACLYEWTSLAVVHAITMRSRLTAELMAQCLPDQEETQAAMWYTSSDETSAERELQFVVRMPPARRAKMTADQVKAKFEAIIERILSSP